MEIRNFDFIEIISLLDPSTIINDLLDLPKRKKKMAFIINGCTPLIKSLDSIKDGINVVNTHLYKTNNYIFCVRGSEEDPSIFTFNNDTIKEKEQRLFFVKDYDVLNFSNVNILCIGGGINVSRSWIEKQIKSGRTDLTYYPNTAPIYDDNIINEIIENKLKIDILISGINPTNICETPQEYCGEWIATDSKLIVDTQEAMNVLKNVYERLLEHKMQPYLWLIPNNDYGKVNSIYNGFTHFMSSSDRDGLLNEYIEQYRREEQDVDSIDKTIFNKINSIISRKITHNFEMELPNPREQLFDPPIAHAERIHAREDFGPFELEEEFAVEEAGFDMVGVGEANAGVLEFEQPVLADDNRNNIEYRRG